MLVADAQCVIPTKDLQADIPFFTNILNMRMDKIYPADDPREAIFSGHGISICIDKDAQVGPGQINLLAEDIKQIANGESELKAPNGTQFKFIEKTNPLFYRRRNISL